MKHKNLYCNCSAARLVNKSKDRDLFTEKKVIKSDRMEVIKITDKGLVQSKKKRKRNLQPAATETSLQRGHTNIYYSNLGKLSQPKLLEVVMFTA